MKLLKNGAVVLVLLLAIAIPSATTHAATVEEMLVQMQALMAQVQELQKQLTTMRGEVQMLLKTDLKDGATDSDVAKIQEILATDPTIYPEGKKTGYFGPLTKEAVKRFQMRHELEITGMIDADTRALLEEYLQEGTGTRQIPEGLLRTPGMMKKIEMRFENKCENKGQGNTNALCQKMKMKYKLEIEDEEDDEDDDLNDDSDDSNDDDDDDSDEDDDEDENENENDDSDDSDEDDN